MKVTVINGTEKHGVTYRLRELLSLHNVWGPEQNQQLKTLSTAFPGGEFSAV